MFSVAAIEVWMGRVAICSAREAHPSPRKTADLGIWTDCTFDYVMLGSRSATDDNSLAVGESAGSCMEQFCPWPVLT